MRTKTKSKAVRDARYALTFGLEAAAVRLGPCVAMRNHNGPGKLTRCWVETKTITDELVLVWDPAHVKSVGAGGGRFDLVSLCRAHHVQQHEIGVDSFAAMCGLDLRDLADEQALAHPRPLGILGLADRWVWWHEHDALGDRGDAGWAAKAGPERLVGYDLAALMAWTRRRMETELASCREQGCDQSQDWNAMIGAVQSDLNWEYHAGNGPCFETAVALCEQPGWPS